MNVKNVFHKSSLYKHKDIMLLKVNKFLNNLTKPSQNAPQLTERKIWTRMRQK